MGFFFFLTQVSCRKSESLGSGVGDHGKVTTWVDGFRISVLI